MSGPALLGAVAALLVVPTEIATVHAHAPRLTARGGSPIMNNQFSMARPDKAFSGSNKGSAANSRKTRRQNLMQQLEAPPAKREPEGAPEDDPAAPLALAAVRAADDRKAKDISALRVGHLTSATSFFVNVVGGSKAQINAIVKNVEDELDEQFGRRANRQGKALSGWVCLDYDEIVVNVFSEKERSFYGIEKFWAAAQELDLTDVVVPNLVGGDSDAWDTTVGGGLADDDDDDDWAFGSDDDWEISEDEWSFAPQSVAAETDTAQAPHAEWTADELDAGWRELDDAAVGASAPLETPPARSEEEAALEAELEAELAREEAQAAASREGKDVAAGRAAALEEVEEEEAPAEEEEDWALGDDKLRALVDSLEGSLGDEGEEKGGGWRAMMAEDGWELDDNGEPLAALEDERADTDDEDE